MALDSQNLILPTDIPPRISSHKAPVFRDSQGNTISPSSPPCRRSSKRPMSQSGGVNPVPYSVQSQGKPPMATSSHYRPQSSHYPASASQPASQAYSTGTVAQGKSHARSSSKPNHQPIGMSPPSQSITHKLVHQKHGEWPAEKEEILLGPFEYLYGHPGKDVRAQLIASFNMWLRVPEASLSIITKVVGMLHTASLLVDDVEDSSLLRRGVPVANSIFGTAQTINSANYVYFLALQELSTLANPTAIQIYTEELLNLHRGQGMDLFWRDTLTCPTEADYLEMVGNKTGGLFRLAIKLMQAESALAQQKGGIDCVPLVSTIGLLFQITDDLLNLSSPTYTARKGLCEDLTEGKFSFPVIHGIRADAGNLVLLNVLKQKTQDEEVKRYAVAYMEKVGSFDYTRAVMTELEGKALELVAELERQVGGDEGRSGAEGVRGILGMLKTL